VFAFGGSESGGSVSGSDVVDVNVTGLTIDGGGTQPDAGQKPGIFFRNAHGEISDNTVENLGVGGKETFGVLAYGIVAAEQLPLRDSESLQTELRNRDQTFWEAVGTVAVVPCRSRLAALIARQTATSTIDDLEAKLLSDPDFWEPGDASTSLRRTLHHADLPQLAEAGLITYDADRHTVSRRPRLSSVVDWLGLCRRGSKGRRG
jgi:hypothetical protein